MSTIDFYDRNAAAFHERTKSIDMQSQMDAFAALLPAGAEIWMRVAVPGAIFSNSSSGDFALRVSTRLARWLR